MEQSFSHLIALQLNSDHVTTYVAHFQISQHATTSESNIDQTAPHPHSAQDSYLKENNSYYGI
jgi:hypothetical protein